MENKQCKQCNSEFTVTDEDLGFYRKIAPAFAGKTYEIPAPQICPQCRMRDKLAFRNEGIFYKIKSKKSGDELVSHYSPETKYTIVSQNEWYSDDWNAFNYGMEFDPNISFFEQFKQLAYKVPIPHAAVHNNENSSYISNASNNKDCYLISGSGNNENCMYGSGFWRSNDCVDCYRVFDCENCYEIMHGYNSMSCFWSRDIENCYNSYFVQDCVGCKDCFACTNLNNKQYYAFNKEFTKEEIDKLVNDFQKLAPEQKREKIKDYKNFLKESPKKHRHVNASEDVSGDYINNSKNVSYGFFVDESENVSNCTNLNKGKDAYDTSFNGPPIERSLNTVTCGINSSNLISCYMVFNNASNVYYSISCIDGCKDCFGCVGLKGKQYCILNKQYTREEYESLVPKITEHMRDTGEWGEFFPADMSPYGYNSSLANYFFPLQEEDAKSMGYNWQDESYDISHDGDFYNPKNILDYDPSKNQDAKQEIQECLKGIIRGSDTGRPFKVISRELSFYIKNRIPIPNKHPEQRQKERFEQFQLYRLYHRQCMCEETGHDHKDRCPVEFETTYAPDRPEKVYCESCYQKTIK